MDLKAKSRATKEAERKSVGADFSEHSVESGVNRAPSAFQSRIQEAVFVCSISISQMILEFVVSGFIALVPALKSASIIDATTHTWSASVVSLVIASFLLPMGRLADMFDAFALYGIGMAWLAIWSIVGAYAKSSAVLITCRAMQGLGNATTLPAGFNILGTLYEPGRRKNIVFSFYGAMAPIGAFLGMLVASLVVDRWCLYFWSAAGLAISSLIMSCLSKPRWCAPKKQVGMDWWGSFTMVPGLLLFTSAFLQAARYPQGMEYVWCAGSTSILLLSIAFYVEARVAADPLLPCSVLRLAYVRPLLCGLLVNYGTVGIYTLYATLYIRDVLKVQPLIFVAWFAPMLLGGCVVAISGGLILHLISGTKVLIISSVAAIVSPLLWALMPVTEPNYWSWIFTSMVCATLAIDVLYNVVGIFLSTTLSADQQGSAGALSNLALHLSVAVWLGAADIVVTVTADQGLAQSYKNAFWLQTACGTASLAIFSCFVRMKRATSVVPTVE